jgi:hypothetical protein
MMPGDPIVGSTVLRRPAIQSPNFVTGTSGWTINSDGSAEFNNLTIRGTFQGTEFIISASGVFLYSPTEAAGNLAESSAPAAGVDGFGNNYVPGHATYDNVNGLAASLDAGLVQFYTGSLAGGWTASGSVQGDPSGDLLLTPAAGRGVLTSNSTLDNGAGAASFAGALTAATLSSGGASSTSTNGLPNGGITGTSGAQSAGTAHTHGGGSYSVISGQHHHTL